MLTTRNLKAGDVLDGRYRLERRVGGGGMGDVWEGTDTILWRTVAVKVLLADLADDRGFRERFRREARAIALMKGPGVVEVYDYGEIEHGDTTVAYLVMEYVDGKPLSRLLGLWGKLPAADALRIVGGVAEALNVAHAAGIVHRDIKPGNILVRDDGSVVLVDFGIARANHNLTLTTTGVVLGTVTYMSPEQAAGENLTTASDLYSLGVVAHQCLAGSPPFKADTPLGVLSAHLRNEPPQLPADVPFEAASVVKRALQKEPSQRWPDAAAFASACRTVHNRIVTGEQAPVAPPSTPMPPTELGPTYEPSSGAHIGRQADTAATLLEPTPADTPPRRRRLWIAFASVIAALGVIGVVAATQPWNNPDGQGILPAGETGGDYAPDVRRQGGEPAATGGVAGDGTAPRTGTDDATSTPDGAEATSPSESAPTSTPVPGLVEPGGDETPTQPAEETASSSPPPPEPETVTVPDVVDTYEGTARHRIEEADLVMRVEYDGDGDHKCPVARQWPASGTAVEPESVA
jgi:serine/threonine-protein kinase